MAAASVLLKAASGGAFTTFSTTKLISVEDALETCRRAGHAVTGARRAHLILQRHFAIVQPGGPGRDAATRRRCMYKA
jgi:hypothetical protein